MIPWILIAAGGLMIFAGVKKQSPIVVIKAILQNNPIPTDTTTNPPGTGSGAPGKTNTPTV